MASSSSEPTLERIAGSSTVDPAALAGIKDIAFGSTAGMIGKVFEYPFDTVKVRLQSQPLSGTPLYTGPLDCFRQSLSSGGIRGLYRGISPPLFGAAVENSALFFFYNLAQRTSKWMLYGDSRSDQILPMSALVGCGAASGAFASGILTPIELVKCKMQVQGVGRPKASASVVGTGSLGAAGLHTSAVRTPGPLELVRQIVRDRGVTGMWHGQMGTFFRETGGGAAWFGAYEYVLLGFRRFKEKQSNSFGEMMLAGAAAGVSYNFILFPADTVKSRMQTETLSAGAKSKGFWEIGRNIYRAGGIAALYRGCGVTILRSAPSSALIFVVYEGLKAHFV